MNTRLDCLPCLLRQALDGVRRGTDDPHLQETILRDLLRLTAEVDLSLSPPALGQRLRRRVRALTGVEDPYQGAKQRFNRLALEALPELEGIVHRAADPLLAAVRFSIAANAIDVGVAGDITDAEVHGALHGALGIPLLGDVEVFGRVLGAANRILFLADNAGEIAIDRLLIEAIGPERVIVAVRGHPVLNDATMEDARAVGMHGIVEVMENGSDVAGTILADCHAEFRRRFREADLIVVKGQGNFETLCEVDGNFLFLLKIKCPVLSQHVGLPLGAHALLHRESASGGRGWNGGRIRDP